MVDNQTLQGEEQSIKDELKDIRLSINANTREQRRRTKLQWWAIGLVALALFAVAGVGALGYIDDKNDDKREDQEEQNDQLKACIRGMNARNDAEDRLVKLAENLDAQPNVINEIHDSYQEAPPLPDCR